MIVSRFAKTVVYLVGTAALMLLCACFVSPMYNPATLEAGYFRSTGFLFAAACVLIGVALYSWRAYTRRHREHFADSLLCLIVGAVYMVAAIAVFLLFGGLEGTFDESAYAAVNVNSVLLSVLPVPFLIRTIQLSLSKGESRGRRIGAAVGAVLLMGLYVFFVASGRMLRTVNYPMGEVPEEVSEEQDLRFV